MSPVGGFNQCYFLYKILKIFSFLNDTVFIISFDESWRMLQLAMNVKLTWKYFYFVVLEMNEDWGCAKEFHSDMDKIKRCRKIKIAVRRSDSRKTRVKSIICFDIKSLQLIGPFYSTESARFLVEFSEFDMGALLRVIG